MTVLARPEAVVARIQDAHTAKHGLRKNFAISSCSRAVIQIISFAGFVGMARLLTPADFGLAAVVTVITGFALLLTDLGLGSAIIQIERPTAELLSTAFWLNVLSGIGLSGVLWACSFPIAAVFHEHELRTLLPIAGLTFSLNASTVHVAVLERTSQFAKIAMADIMAAALGITTALVAAACGLGPVSIVLQAVVNACAGTIIYWVLLPFVPSFRLRWPEVRKLYAFGGGVAGFNIVNYWSRSADNLFLGAFSTPFETGLYSRAYQIMMIPITQANAALNRVLLPALARKSGADRAQSYLSVSRAVCALGWPLSILMAATAPDVVPSVFGARWSGMVPPLVFLALAMPPQLLLSTIGPAYQAVGRSGELFRRASLTSAFTIAGFAVTAMGGAQPVAVFFLIRSLVILPFLKHPVLQHLGIPVRDFWGSLVGVISASVLLGTTCAVLEMLPLQGWRAALLQFASGIFVYCSALRILDHRTFYFFADMVNRKLPRADDRTVTSATEPPVS